MFKLTAVSQSSHFGSFFGLHVARFVGLEKTSSTDFSKIEVCMAPSSPNFTRSVPYQFNQLPRFFIPADLTNLVFSSFVRTSLCVSFPIPSAEAVPPFSVDLTSF